MKAFSKLPAIVLFILALVFSLDLFLFPGRSITFDAHIHMTTFAQFANALADGEFPVRWASGFANYGHPLPLFAHQTTAYIGGVLTLVFNSPVLAYNFLVLLSAFLSSWLLYRFLRSTVSTEAALLGAALFTVAPYRLVNVYVRGALPEFFGLLFLPWILIGVHQAVVQRRWIGLLNTFLATALLAFTHPMLLLIAAVVVVPYVLFVSWPWLKNWKVLLGLGTTALVGIASASAYIFPLLYDIRYTNYGAAGPQFSDGDFLSLSDLFYESWGYFGSTHPGPRAETLTPGVIELTILALTLIAVVVWRKRKESFRFYPWIFIGILALFLMLPLSRWVYENLPFAGNIQFPWRMLSAFVFVPAILLALAAENKRVFPLAGAIVLLALVLRFPQAYGKNYLNYSNAHYEFTRANLHSNNMNSIWMGDPASYPRRDEKLEIISGDGSYEVLSHKNASRVYKVQASTPLRLVEYTFYFPGWKAYVDEEEVPVQFQDPNYRGVITFEVPAGEHTVKVRFEDTKIRLLGFGVTGAGLGVAVLGLALERKYRWFLRSDS